MLKHYLKSVPRSDRRCAVCIPVRQSARCARSSMLLLLLGLAFANRLPAQTGTTGSLHGTVQDPSGGALPNAPVRATSAAGQISSATTNSTGAYELNNLPAGPYTIEVTVTGFAPFKKESVAVAANRAEQFDITLAIQGQEEQVTVAGEASSVDTNPSNNASAVVFAGQQLEALPDDPDALKEDLEALAGPSAGPTEAQMYLDGFTAGELPPKSSIREIRINQNPFSAEFDKVGYGRIEIFTKPGTNQWHGQASVNFTDPVFNARNPFITTSVPYYDSLESNENVGGALGKNGSIFFNADYRNINDQSVVSAEILNSSNAVTPFSATIANPRKRLNIGPQVDYQLTKNNTISVRYQYWWNQETGDGVGGTTAALASQAYDVLDRENTLQATDTQILGSKIINQTRFQYLGRSNSLTSQDTLPAVSVPGDFIEGGSNLGTGTNHQNRYELQNHTSIAFEKHFLKFGVRLREETDATTDNGGFNGSFIFACLTPTPSCSNALSTGSPSQFRLTTGLLAADVSMFDAGVYIQDDWRLRPNITLSYGLRLETQTHISDRADWAPRVGIAWGIGGGRKKAPQTVLRVGWGIFYDRFTTASILEAERFNGVTQQTYTINNPGFFCPDALSACPSVSTIASLSASVPVIYQVAPNLRAPLLMQTAVSLERQLNRIVNVSVSYLNFSGYRQLLTDNINSPVLPGTLTPASLANGGRYPNGISEAIYQFTSTGIFRQNQLVANTTVRAGAKLLLNGYYTLNYADSDTLGVNTFPSDPYNVLADYGRAAFDVRHRAFFGATITLPWWALRLSPFMVLRSGAPYNITLIQDLIGSTTLNQRPGFVSSSACSTTQITGSIYCTPFGTFDSHPTAGEALVPINFLTGPSQFSLNVRLAKTFSFGGKAGEGTPGAQGGHGPGGPVGGGGENANTGRFDFTLSINVRNIFNNVNLATPIGALTSTEFGMSNSLAGGGGPGGNAANRAVYLQGIFAF
jgi:Carboxypeptidase regulatory-like domain